MLTKETYSVNMEKEIEERLIELNDEIVYYEMNILLGHRCFISDYNYATMKRYELLELKFSMRDFREKK